MKDYVSIADEFAGHLLAGRIQEATAMLAPFSRARGAAMKMQDLWRQLLTNYGKPLMREALGSHPLNGMMVVYFRFEFERGRVPACAVCTMDGAVHTFVFKRADEYQKFGFFKDPLQYRRIDMAGPPEPAPKPEKK